MSARNTTAAQSGSTTTEEEDVATSSRGTSADATKEPATSESTERVTPRGSTPESPSAESVSATLSGSAEAGCSTSTESPSKTTSTTNQQPEAGGVSKASITRRKGKKSGEGGITVGVSVGLPPSDTREKSADTASYVVSTAQQQAQNVSSTGAIPKTPARRRGRKGRKRTDSSQVPPPGPLDSAAAPSLEELARASAQAELESRLSGAPDAAADVTRGITNLSILNVKRVGTVCPQHSPALTALNKESWGFVRHSADTYCQFMKLITIAARDALANLMAIESEPNLRPEDVERCAELLKKYCADCSNDASLLGAVVKQIETSLATTLEAERSNRVYKEYLKEFSHAAQVHMKRMWTKLMPKEAAFIRRGDTKAAIEESKAAAGRSNDGEAANIARVQIRILQAYKDLIVMVEDHKNLIEFLLHEIRNNVDERSSNLQLACNVIMQLASSVNASACPLTISYSTNRNEQSPERLTPPPELPKASSPLLPTPSSIPSASVASPPLPSPSSLSSTVMESLSPYPSLPSPSSAGTPSLHASLPSTSATDTSHLSAQSTLHSPFSPLTPPSAGRLAIPPAVTPPSAPPSPTRLLQTPLSSRRIDTIPSLQFSSLTGSQTSPEQTELLPSTLPPSTTTPVPQSPLSHDESQWSSSSSRPASATSLPLPLSVDESSFSSSASVGSSPGSGTLSPSQRSARSQSRASGRARLTPEELLPSGARQASWSVRRELRRRLRDDQKATPKKD